MSVQQVLFKTILASLKYRKIMLKRIAINNSSEIITTGLNKNSSRTVLKVNFRESLMLLHSGIWILFLVWKLRAKKELREVSLINVDISELL